MSVPILVASCGSYSDLWHPLRRALIKEWPDCPYPLVLLTDWMPEKHPPLPNCELIVTGETGAWSDNMIAGLKSLSKRTEYCFLWIEDLLPSTPIDSKKIVPLIDLAIKRQWPYFRIDSNMPPPSIDPDFASLKIGKLPKGDQYRASVVMSLWRIPDLLKILVPGETAWQFETSGSVRSDAFDDFYCCAEPHIKTLNSVIKGKWDPRVLKTLMTRGILTAEDIQRPVLAGVELLVRRLNEFRSMLFKLVPRRWRRSLHLALRKY